MNKKCLFIGSKELGLSILKSIVKNHPGTVIGCVTYDDSDDCRSKFNEFKDFAKENNLKLYVLKKQSELNRIISEAKPDFCLVIGWYWIIKKETLDLCKDGFIGIHASMLPKYRGCAPIVWAMINGEKSTGISMFYFDEGIDSGDIISNKSISILDSDYIADVLKKVEYETERMILSEYPLILKGENKRIKQSKNEITYCAQRTPEQGRINWNLNAKEVYNFIRAQSKPYPGAFTTLKDNTIVKIYKAEVFEYIYYGKPGQIVSVNGNEVLVVCKNSALKLILNKKDFNNEINTMFKYGDILI